MEYLLSLKVRFIALLAPPWVWWQEVVHRADTLSHDPSLAKNAEGWAGLLVSAIAILAAGRKIVRWAATNQLKEIANDIKLTMTEHGLKIVALETKVETLAGYKSDMGEKIVDVDKRVGILEALKKQDEAFKADARTRRRK